MSSSSPQLREIGDAPAAELAEFLANQLTRVREAGLYRSFRIIESEQDAEVTLRDERTGESRRVILFCANNYLGLANHPRLKHAAADAALRYGVGSGASRHISGSMSLHEKLERRIAEFKRCERAVIFNTGFSANLGIISALVGPGDAVFSDELNHASIIDGCRMSGAEKQIYAHRDLDDLERRLAASAARHKLIVTDSIFSMDGDLAPLPGIVELARRYGAWTMIDEAHATGCIGPGGRGVAEHFGLTGKIDVVMGTLGKGLGSFGAFAAGSKDLIDHLINRSRPLIFTTALPPAVLAASAAAFDVIGDEPSRREQLQAKAARVRGELQRMGFSTLNSETQIIPVVVGEADVVMEFARRLLDLGIFITGIRPPTVPAGTCRLRVTVMSNHTGEHIERLLGGLETIGRDLGVL